MNKKTLVSLVKEEASKLKKNATKEEIKRLSFLHLAPTSSSHCIYGQMTGDCFSPRAHALINECCERVYESHGGSDLSESYINGKPELSEILRFREGKWSPIECFIWFKKNHTGGNNQRLVNYLKGKTNRLTFRKF